MTRSDPCFRLDEFLAGDLDGDPRDEFERHLAECPQCREEAESYARIVQMLQAADRERGGCPPLLSARIHEAVSRRRSRRRITAAAAAVVLVAVAGLAWMAGRSGPAAPRPEPKSMAAAPKHEPIPTVAPESPDSVRVVEPVLPAPPEPPDPQVAAVTVEFGDDVIGVPIETDDPSVTILWVYPTLGQVAAGD
jgi:anti-sigma factor RsiW